MAYSYQKSEPGRWTVGCFTSGGIWQTESSWNTPEEAAERIHWLNGGQSAVTDDDEASSHTGQK